jgi:hypothetical protein
MTLEIINISDLDCIFLTYDEPKKEEFWIQIQNLIPWVKRVDGIRGSDSAHKAAASASETDRFIVIDGDNIPDPSFFKKTLTLNNQSKDYVFRWKARNVINELTYGNGGISCWTKNFVNSMKTHENTDGQDYTKFEFCYNKNYVSMHDCFSTTYPNATPYQAWRAGFREGVKLCLNKGVKPNINNFKQNIHIRNYELLSIWHNIGQDIENGWWAIYGARLGTYLTLLRQWDYTKVQSFDELKALWNSFSKDTQYACESLGKTLKLKLNLPIVEMNAEQSKFFKSFYAINHKNKGIMEYERAS